MVFIEIQYKWGFTQHVIAEQFNIKQTEGSVCSLCEKKAQANQHGQAKSHGSLLKDLLFDKDFL